MTSATTPGGDPQEGVAAIEQRLKKRYLVRDTFDSPGVGSYTDTATMFEDLATLISEVKRYKTGVERIANLGSNSGSSLDACIDIAGELLRGAP